MLENKGFIRLLRNITFMLLILFFIVSVLYTRFIMPVSIKICQKYATTTINNQIQKAVASAVDSNKITATDFISSNESSNNRLEYMNVNSMLVNSICSQVATALSSSLNKMDKQRVHLPLGTYTGMNFLSHLGPTTTITLEPMGDATVDYDTSMTQAGVNEVNFQVWLNIHTNVSIVNPLWSKDLEITRRLSLVNTVFNGEIPKTYINIQ